MVECLLSLSSVAVVCSTFPGSRFLTDGVLVVAKQDEESGSSDADAFVHFILVPYSTFRFIPAEKNRDLGFIRIKCSTMRSRMTANYGLRTGGAESLQGNSPSSGWVDEAFRSLDATDEEHCRQDGENGIHWAN